MNKFTIDAYSIRPVAYLLLAGFSSPVCMAWQISDRLSWAQPNFSDSLSNAPQSYINVENRQVLQVYNFNCKAWQKNKPYQSAYN